MEQQQKFDAAYYNSRAVQKISRKQFREALVDYSKALYLAGDDPSIYYSRALVYLEMNQLSQARADLMKARDLGLSIPGDLMK